jgi:hypothetical protein
LLFVVRRLFLLLGFILSACESGPGTIGGAYYATAYDFSEFYRVTNDKTFRVIVAGNPFPALKPEEMRRRLLPVMQANRPRPRLTFTYDAPDEEQRPDYRMVLVFDAAPDLSAQRVCADQIRTRPEPRGRFDVFAVYCRNDAPLSQTTASTTATSPEDPRVGQLFSQLFLVLFIDTPPIRRPPRVRSFGIH